MAESPMVGARVDPETKQRIKKLSERDCVPEASIIKDLIDMAIDKREAWYRPKPPTL